MISLLLIGSAAATGALAGTVLAVALAGPLALTSSLGRPSPLALTVALVSVGLALDAAALRFGRPRPVTNGGQVPRRWSSLFEPRVVAVLYGARLGVGPLTILSTWGWWAATVASAILGVGPAALVGATFGLVRQVATVAVSLAAGRGDHAERFGRLGRARRRGWAALNGASLVMVLAVSLAACGQPPGGADGDGARPMVTRPPAAHLAHRGPPSDRAPGDRATPRTSTVDPPPPTAAGPTEGTGPAVDDGPGGGATGIGGDRPVSTRPARLEDHVRPSPSGADTPTRLSTGQRPAPTPESLAADLPRTLAGFEPVDDPSADRFLDLAAAAAIQPDPAGETALLETRGYRGGWIRAFRSPGNDVAVASVYELADAGEAELYLEDGLIMIGGYGGRFFDIEGLPGVRGFSQRVDDGGEDLVALGAAFASGRRWFLLYLLGSPETVTPEALVPAVAAQWRAELPGATAADG